MSGSVRTDQELLNELAMLRTRVTELEQEREQALAHGQQKLERLQQDQVAHTAEDKDAPVYERLVVLEAIFETIKDALAVYAPSGKIVRANRAFYQLMGIEHPLEYDNQSLQERGQLVRLSDEHGVPLPEELWPARRALRGEVITSENAPDITFFTMDGREIQADITGAPLRDSYGNVIGAVIVLHDITQRKRLEMRYVEDNRRMDEFLSIASHELRTPMTTINGNIQLAMRRVRGLSRPEGGPPDYEDKLALIQELLSRAERQVRIQNRLVSDLLDVSRIQANRLELNIAECDLAAITREAVEDQRFSVPRRTILLHNVSPELSIPIQADADRIGQVITNFLTNALKYSDEDTTVDVDIQLQDTYARVSVHDKGPGLPEDERKRLWERFYRVPGIRIRSGSGMSLGLGLYICHTIIELHNGQIGVDSTVGEGSTFWFMLPLA
ncbi:hypothetical protein KDA_27790 [Dictyobacter alpinus]|uniref:histidine kinase n=1 Tax=Dictyobacter alpinus TaxID=2014873 RepID=A0A402B7G1_9CHLR|nr:PAS domain-containing sensor histidine kinase [Dictyobacter alpinus]GCE27295.1 hypothetical protein KDA_27790 [Dictyobacter alpinus]